MLRIGYACLAVGVPGTDMKRCLLKNASEERLTRLIYGNLTALDTILDYNIRENILLFRISSNLIPFGSSPINQIQWWDVFSEQLQRLGEKVTSHGLRVSMHPGQYTVLNSGKAEVVAQAVNDLLYHGRVLDSMHLSFEHKLVLHVGGVYGDKEKAMERFITNYDALPDSIKKRLVIENDDKSYTIEDVLRISANTDIPVVYDCLHNEVNPCTYKTDADWIEICEKTWRNPDGVAKIHYAQQAEGKNPGSHSESITLDAFLTFYSTIKNKELDVMLEVKDKNRSVVKCIQAINQMKSSGIDC